MSEKMIEDLRRRLNAKTIHDIRQIARAVGVARPADGKKERIIDGIMSIAEGKSDPVEKSVRGAHPKSAEYDRQLVADINRCREICLYADGDREENNSYVCVSSPPTDDALEFSAGGILEKIGDKWFMHINGSRESFLFDVYVSEYFINACKLREGDYVHGICKRNSVDEMAGLAHITNVNGISPDAVSDRCDFEKLTPVYADRIFKTAVDGKDVLGRITDLLSPVGAGQRAFVTAPHGCGKTEILKQLAKGIQINNPGVKTVIVLIDARPEEAAEFKRAFPETDVFTSVFDAGVNSHVRTAELSLKYAKRIVENKKDVVLILDDLTRLTRAYNVSGNRVSINLDSAALDSAKKFLAAARNTEEGGSLTIISALDADGDPFDEAVYSGLKNLCNMRITLSKQLARARVYPPVDVLNTCAYGDSRLLTLKELQTAEKLRSSSLEEIIELIRQTRDNNELCDKLLR